MKIPKQIENSPILAFRRALAILAVFSISHVSALEVTGEAYSITFPKDWTMMDSAQGVVVKNQGLGGMAYVNAVPDPGNVNVDSLSQFLDQIPEAQVRKGKHSSFTAGKYTVHMQEYLYDSLPLLEGAIEGQTGAPIPLRDGEFRLYYVQADGYVFSIMAMPMVKFLTPYSDVEAALKTLVLKIPSAIASKANADRAGSFHISQGKLIFSKGQAPRSVTFIGWNGRALGHSKMEIQDGLLTWSLLPRGAAAVRLDFSDMSSLSLPITSISR